MTLKVSDIGEKELVKYIIANSNDIIPDDTAITQLNDSNLISTCDMLIQSRHFPKNMSYFALFLFLKTKQNSRTIKKYQAFNEVLQ